MGRQGTERFWAVEILWKAGIHGEKMWSLIFYARGVLSKWKCRRAARKRCRGARILSMKRMWNMDGGGFDGAIDAEALLK